MATIEQMNRDFEAFYEFCKENHLTDDDVRKLCQPFLNTIRKTKFIRYIKICIVTTLLLLILYTICSTETVSWHLSAIGRIVMIKILPFYDWTQLRSESCLIKRSQSDTFQTNTFSCVLCESIQEIAKLQEFDREDIYENYIKLHVPVKLTHFELPWKIKTMPVSNLTEFLTINKILSTSYPCKLSTNLFTNYDQQFIKILNRASNAERYFIHFQNCMWEAVKHFRIFTPRPAILHRKIAPIQYSWLLLNRNYKVDKFKQIDLQENIAVVVQTLGRTRFRLVPQRKCENECFVLEEVLQEGEVLILTSLWDLEYKPMDQGENIAVILETH